MKRQFNVGDLVHIRPLPLYMGHFPRGYGLITKYSHNECQAGNENEHNYGVLIRRRGYCSWYNNENLKLIKKNQMHLWEKFIKEPNEL